jgi:hypothetical protein
MQQEQCSTVLVFAGEPRVSGVPDTTETCVADCPITLGPCPSPGGGELGDQQLECGGNGVCDPLTRTCRCNVGYAGEACGWCASTTHRADGDICAVKLSAVVALDEVPADDVATPGTRVSAL